MTPKPTISFRKSSWRSGIRRRIFRPKKENLSAGWSRWLDDEPSMASARNRLTPVRRNDFKTKLNNNRTHGCITRQRRKLTSAISDGSSAESSPHFQRPNNRQLIWLFTAE